MSERVTDGRRARGASAPLVHRTLSTSLIPYAIPLTPDIANVATVLGAYRDTASTLSLISSSVYFMDLQIAQSWIEAISKAIPPTQNDYYHNIKMLY